MIPPSRVRLPARADTDDQHQLASSPLSLAVIGRRT